MHNCAELPRDIREKLVSWNHTAEYDSSTHQDYASRLGGGQFEKIWDLGAATHPIVLRHRMPCFLMTAPCSIYFSLSTLA